MLIEQLAALAKQITSAELSTESRKNIAKKLERHWSIDNCEVNLGFWLDGITNDGISFRILVTDCIFQYFLKDESDCEEMFMLRIYDDHNIPDIRHQKINNKSGIKKLNTWQIINEEAKSNEAAEDLHIEDMNTSVIELLAEAVMASTDQS